MTKMPSALNLTTSLIALSLAAPALAQTMPTQTLASGEGFSIETYEEPTREAIYGKETSHVNPDWFYVGIADLTFGRRSNSSPLRAGQSGDYTRGRVAGYANGPLGRGYTLTFAIDTTDTEIEDLFKGLGDKTPQDMLERLDDPDRYYPAYGDDSTFEETAPTIGKFYLRVEDGKNHAMWGNFRSTITGTEYLRNERTLYGAQAVYNADQLMEDGRPRTRVEAYVASPETVTQRDVFLGTGGSSYFLKERDVAIGSETLQIEIRDARTGAVVSRRTLAYGTDYRINYTQGLVLLTTPLTSTQGGGSVAPQGTSGFEAYLVATYEYEPITADTDAYAGGARVEAAFSDTFRVGISAERHQTLGQSQRALGADAEFRISPDSFARIEVAQTDGPGTGFSTSTDGGQILTDSGTVTGTGQAARLTFGADLSEITSTEGSIKGYAEQRTAGFSTLTTQVTDDETLWGLDLTTKTSEKTKLRVAAASLDRANGQASTDVSAEIDLAARDDLALTFGASHLDKSEPSDPTQTGTRTNLGARLSYTLSEHTVAFAFAEGTAERFGGLQDENRAGIGTSAALTEQLSVTGEVSSGTGGMGAELRADYTENETDRAYFGYKLDPNRTLAGVPLTGDDQGRFVLGGTRRLGARVNSFAENTYDLFGAHRALTSAYGLDYTASTATTYSLAMEVGRIEDDASGDFDRNALSIGGLYKNDDGLALNARLELRTERGQSRDSDSALLRFAASQKFDETRRGLAEFGAVVSDRSGASIPATEFVEASVGYAIRPVEAKSLNSLFKYTFLLDDQTQTTGGSTATEPAQRSHVFSLDADRALTDRWTLGAKVAGRLAESNNGGGWVENNAALGVLTARYAIAERWDLLGDLRTLSNFSNDTQDTGALIAAYLHMNKTVMLGAGYNFSQFSDDLTDLTYDDKGGFVNLIAKF